VTARAQGWNDEGANKYYAMEAESKGSPTEADKVHQLEAYRRVVEEVTIKTGSCISYVNTFSWRVTLAYFRQFWILVWPQVVLPLLE
jgi:hypothetical protein